MSRETASQQNGGAHRPAAHAESELIEALEPDQLAANAARPLSRMRIARRTEILLGILRGFAFAITAIVIYTFLAQILH